jgi:hypothetical protein
MAKKKNDSNAAATAKKPPKLKVRKGGKSKQAEKPSVLRPVTGRTTKAEIEELLAKANGAPAPAVTQLDRKAIHAAEEGVFQARCYERDRIRSARHIDTLKKALLTQGAALKPIQVFWAGDRFFAVDGHHRLAAYDYADWDRPIPVEVFEGSLEKARLAALQGNIEDKLPMTPAEKFDAAWRLVKEGSLNRLSKRGIANITKVAIGTVTAMRSKWREIETTGDDSLLKMDWVHARRWPNDDGQHLDESWRDEKVRSICERLVRNGLADEMQKHPDMVLEAITQIDPDLPAKLLLEAGQEAAEWVLEQYRLDGEMKARLINYAEHQDEMHEF